MHKIPHHIRQPNVLIRHDALRHALPRFWLLVVLGIDADIPQWELAVLPLEINSKTWRILCSVSAVEQNPQPESMSLSLHSQTWSR